METVNPNGTKSYKMKGHTLPGINQKSEGNTDLPDGRSGSSALQQNEVLEEQKQKQINQNKNKYTQATDAENEGYSALNLTVGGSRVDVFDKEGTQYDEEGNPIKEDAAAKAIYTEEEKTGKSAGGIDYDEPAKGPNLPM